MSEWKAVKEIMPPVGCVVRCLLQWDESGRIWEYDLVHVEEDDCLWRTADSDDELSYHISVVAWKKKKLQRGRSKNE